MPEEARRAKAVACAGLRRLLGASAIFLLSIGVSFASPLAAQFSWALIALVRPLAVRLTRVPH